MKNENENEGGCASGEACSSCACKGGKWTWIILALALAGVLFAKYVIRKTTAAVPTVVAPSAAIQTGQADQFKRLPRLVDLGAGKCMSCKMMTPILADLKETYVGKMEVTFIDVWENEDAAKQYGINVIPTQIFYNADGKELFRHEGFFGKEDILAKWQELGVELTL